MPTHNEETHQDRYFREHLDRLNMMKPVRDAFEYEASSIMEGMIDFTFLDDSEKYEDCDTQEKYVWFQAGWFKHKWDSRNGK